MRQSDLLFMPAAMMLASCGGAGGAEQDTVLIGKSNIQIEDKHIIPEALRVMGRIGSVAISPDEKQIAYSMAYYSILENKGNNELFIMNTNGSNSKQITRDNWQESRSTWIKGKVKIVFLCDGTGGSQI